MAILVDFRALVKKGLGDVVLGQAWSAGLISSTLGVQPNMDLGDVVSIQTGPFWRPNVPNPCQGDLKLRPLSPFWWPWHFSAYYKYDRQNDHFDHTPSVASFLLAWGKIKQGILRRGFSKLRPLSPYFKDCQKLTRFLRAPCRKTTSHKPILKKW